VKNRGKNRGQSPISQSGSGDSGNRALTPIFLLALFLPSVALAQDGQLGINVYGFSYHFDRDRAKRTGVDNEFNPGLGLRYRRQLDTSWEGFLDGGAYRDSGRNTAIYAGGGALYRATPRLRLGAALALFHSDTYNRGDAFIAPLPVAAYDFDRVTFNVVYMPKVRDFNSINTLGFWLTVWLDR
jgi:hypothetical protein